MNPKSILFVVLCLFFICGCSAKPEKVEPEEAKKFAKKMTYFQDKNVKEGLCFGVIAVTKNRMDQEGIGLATVPCEKVQHLLVNP